MSGVLFRKWIGEAAAGLLTAEQAREFRIRFLRAAANDSGGEKVRVPQLVSPRTDAMRIARKLVEVGATADECKALIGESFCKSTFYRWRAKAAEVDKVFDAFGKDHHAIHPCLWGYVYALRFEGPCGESYYKIGRSQLSPRERARAICRDTDLTLVEAASVGYAEPKKDATSDTLNVELIAHNTLAEYRIDLEWFSIPHDMDWVIEAMIGSAKAGFDRQFVRRT